MKERSMDEMIRHFNNTVCDMKISRKDKLTILGLITAIGYKYQRDIEALTKEPGVKT